MGQKRYRRVTTKIGKTTPTKHKPRTVRILPITDRGGQTRYYMDGWPLPVPAWMYHLNGLGVRSIVTLTVLALIGVGTGVAMLLRLLGRL